MQTQVKREIKFFIPVFITIVVVAVGIGFLMPDKIPIHFDIAGHTKEWMQKSDIKYHIPIPELISYVILTILQFHYAEKNLSLSNFIFHAKLVIILFLGTMIPLSIYFFALKSISSIWYLLGPVAGILVIYVFILSLITGILDKPKKETAKVVPLKTRDKKRKR